MVVRRNINTTVGTECMSFLTYIHKTVYIRPTLILKISKNTQSPLLNIGSRNASGSIPIGKHELAKYLKICRKTVVASKARGVPQRVFAIGYACKNNPSQRFAVRGFKPTLSSAVSQ